MKELDNNSFDTAIATTTPVLVDFWAGWCMPCKMFAPVLEELSDELDGKAVFYKLNIDDYGEIASRYGVTSIPTLILFKNGEEQERMIGVNPKDKVVNLVNKHQ
ncbi:MAG: thioredoxin [Oscillospiraceae bacterium]